MADGVGLPTLEDILAELRKPGRDPRQAFEAPQFRDDVQKVEDLKEGMVLQGTVTNVVTSVTVTDSTAKSHPIANVLITLSVTSNNGSFHISGNTAYTNVDGIATFPDLHIDKAGGYTMTATSEVGGSTSTFFNINGH